MENTKKETAPSEEQFKKVFNQMTKKLKELSRINSNEIQICCNNGIFVMVDSNTGVARFFCP